MLHVINPTKELSRIGKLVFIGSFFLIFEAFLVLKIPIANFGNIFGFRELLEINFSSSKGFSQFFNALLKSNTIYVYFWTIIALIFFGLISVFIRRGSILAIRLHRGFTGFWIGVSLAFTLAQQNIALGFFTLCLSFYSYLLSRYITVAFQRSFINPNCPWFQRVPNPLGPLRISLIDRSGSKKEFQVSRIDGDGCFAFSEKSDLRQELGNQFGQKVEKIELHFREFQIVTNALPIRWLMRGPVAVGMGLQFKTNNNDDRKDLLDFVYRLKGEGYGEDYSTFF